MLAQSFKTAEELGLSETDRGALIKTLGMLERDEVPEHLFTMVDVGHPECGTPGCIKGWACTVGFTRRTVPRFGTALYELFYPDGTKPYEACPSQAASALRGFLTTGEPCWAEAMS